MTTKSLVQVHDLHKHFRSGRGLLDRITRTSGSLIPAVDGVSFEVGENETLGLVGESGCGKSTIGRTILRLTEPTRGRIVFAGQDISTLAERDLRPLRAQMQMIFQDLDAGLNPKMRVRDILAEALTLRQKRGAGEVRNRIRELLDQVNLKASKLANFPRELSGGEKRRVGLARILAVGARFIVADEPTSALDVSIQAQVVNLLRDLQTRLGLSYLFISHDLQLVELVSHRVAVMYLGKIVEAGRTEQIAHRPRHPYTAILWSSLVEKQNREAAGTGSRAWGIFDFERPTQGCRFAPRCPVYEARGRPAVCTDPAHEPVLQDAGGDHFLACHFPIS